MNFAQFKNGLLLAANDLIKREQELSQLDSQVGDGDHGVTIHHSFTAIKKAIIDEKPEDMISLLTTCAMALSEVAGGAIGPILSAFFLGMIQGIPTEKDFSTTGLVSLFDAGLKQIQVTGGAQVGDKTLIDALSPAIKALKENTDLPPKEAMKLAVKMAYDGALSTRSMISRKGRSKNLGDRSLGYVDAGSMTMYYFLNAFSEGL
jgi:dihydroxyacetone kinase-like protein